MKRILPQPRGHESETQGGDQEKQPAGPAPCQGNTTADRDDRRQDCRVRQGQRREDTPRIDEHVGDTLGQEGNIRQRSRGQGEKREIPPDPDEVPLAEDRSREQNAAGEAHQPGQADARDPGRPPPIPATRRLDEPVQSDCRQARRRPRTRTRERPGRSTPGSGIAACSSRPGGGGTARTSAARASIRSQEYCLISAE